MANTRNADGAAKPGPHYQSEKAVIHGERTLHRGRKVKVVFVDARTRLPWEPPNA